MFFTTFGSMIRNLSIKNYKSIKEMNLSTKRVNVFIGEHNSGKSNILEALSWLSINALDSSSQQLFRYKTATDFFYDFDTSQPIEVETDELNLFIRYAKNNQGALLNYFEGLIYNKKLELKSALNDINNIKQLEDFCLFQLNLSGGIGSRKGNVDSHFRTYVFKRLLSFENKLVPFLSPPFGENIPSLLISNKSFKELVSALFKEKGFRLMLKPTETDISMAKDVNDELYSYPYQSISETLQRIVFYTLAIESNKNSILILDEPESNTFPMYTKQMAEMIALDSSNQYFIATHNPYLLDSLISKTPTQDLAVFITRMEDYKTVATLASEKSVEKLLSTGADFFFNLDKLLVTNE